MTTNIGASLRLAVFGCVAALVPWSGCSFLLDLLNPGVTSVRLQNNSDFDVDVRIFIDDEQDVPEDLIDEVGSELNYTLSPGESAEFSRDCEDLQAIMIDRAELRVIGQIGPEAGT